MPLKSRTYDNNWGGGKSGARNAWISSIKENGDLFDTVRDGLITLENTFFNFCGGQLESSINNSKDTADTEIRSKTGRELLQDIPFRFEIELESVGQAVKGLWNSFETRSVFLELVSCKKGNLLLPILHSLNPLFTFLTFSLIF